MDKETIDWLIYLVNFRKEYMNETMDLTDSEVAECFKAETEMANKVLNQLEKLQNIGGDI
tara:strand:- start:238 stop:417 length:180 start_codon:yes stop_codon:yes gene_type:complete